MTDWENPKVRQSAYKKQSVSDMTFEELCAILITSDGKGVKMKTQALQEVIAQSCITGSQIEKHLQERGLFP